MRRGRPQTPETGAISWLDGDPIEDGEQYVGTTARILPIRPADTQPEPEPLTPAAACILAALAMVIGWWDVVIAWVAAL